MSTKDLTKPAPQAPQAVRPRVDVLESASEYLVVADMPGVAKDAVDVHFADGELRLQGRRDAAATEGAITQEQRHGNFERAFAMPDDVDGEKISAELSNGILKVHLPKQSAKQPRKIEVRAS